MGSIPLPALDIKPPENPLDQYAKALSVKSMIGGQQLQQQQIQGAQLENQSRSIQNQQEQLALNNAKIVNSASTDPDTLNKYNDWLSSKKQSGEPMSDPTSPQQATPSASSPASLHPFAQFLNEEKGLPLMGKGGALEVSQTLNAGAKSVADAVKAKGDAALANLNVYEKQIANFNQQAAPIVEASQDPTKTPDDIAKMASAFQNELRYNPDKYPPEASKHIEKMNTVDGIVAAVNTAGLHQMVLEHGTKLAENQTAQANALQKTRLAAGVTDENGKLNPQAQSAVDSLATFRAIPAPMRTALGKEMQNAPDMETLLKVQARADAANESFQRSADTRQQALAMKDVAVGQAMAGQLIKQDETLQGAMNQTAGIRGLLDMSKGGNETATAAAQTRFAEHEIVEGGVKRMNQTEFNQLATNLGDYGRQFSAWQAKGFQGKMPPATNAEMQKILDAEDATAQRAHDQSIGIVQERFSQITGGGVKNPVKAPTPPPAAAASQFQVGQQVKLKNGTTITIKAVHPDGTFD